MKMKIGVPKEIKDQEFRVGATPQIVKILVKQGHEVVVERGAGKKVGFSDESYKSNGAKIVETAQEVYLSSLIVKVKEPQMEEFPLLQEGQILFCYLHLAPDPKQTEKLLEKKVIGIAYETITSDSHQLPLLTPMSEVAGRLAVQVGATHLQMNHGGKGVLLGGIPGVAPSNVLILGGGVVGTEAAKMALGLGANVKIFDKNLERLRKLDDLYGPRLKTIFSNEASIEESLSDASLIIGAVLIPGGKAPFLITKNMLKLIPPGSVIVDVAIDQGGCCETSRPTSHSNPTFVEEGVIHYCVTNMPSACAKTATQGLTNATFPFLLKLANLGYQEALKQDLHLLNGLNVFKGKVTHPAVAEALGYPYVPPSSLL